MRQSQKTGQEICQQKGQRPGQIVAILQEIAGELPAHDLRTVPAQPEQHARIEGFDAVGHLREAVKQPACQLRQPGMVALAGLDFHDQRGFPGKERQHFLQIGDLFLRPLQPAGIQLLRGHIADVPLHAGGALQTLVVHDHQTAVPAQMYVQLRAVARLYGKPESGKRIFGNALPAVMQPPVGVVIAFQSEKTGLSAFGAECQQPQQAKQQQNAGADPKNNHKISPLYPGLPALFLRRAGYLRA